MRNGLIAIITALSVATLPVAASADAARGRITEANNNVYVMRNGVAVAARPGMPLFAGDRVITRSNGRAVYSLDGCRQVVGETSISAVGAAGCGAAPQNFADMRAGAPMDGAAGLSDSSMLPIYLLLGGVLIAGGAVAAGGGGGKPVSP